MSKKCEYCEFYNYDELLDDYRCTVTLDEDEQEKFLRQRTTECPYYKHHDEYKSVAKQN